MPYKDDYFSPVLGEASESFSYTELSPEEDKKMRKHIYNSRWMKDWHKEETTRGAKVSRKELMNFMISPDKPGQNYDYAGAWQAYGKKMFGDHPDGRQHGLSKTPSGKWLKDPRHPTAWKEVYMQSDPEVHPDSSTQIHPDLPRSFASDYLKQRKKKKRKKKASGGTVKKAYNNPTRKANYK